METYKGVVFFFVIIYSVGVADRTHIKICAVWNTACREDNPKILAVGIFEMQILYGVCSTRLTALFLIIAICFSANIFVGFMVFITSYISSVLWKENRMAPLRWADPSPRGVLPSKRVRARVCVCVCVCVECDQVQQQPCTPTVSR
jgi:hypothetical protein